MVQHAAAPAFAGKWANMNPPLTPWVLDTVHNTFNFESLTPIQASLIPLAITKNKDFLIEAITGSGKTLSYVVPILERLIRRESQLAVERSSSEGGANSLRKGLKKNEVFAMVIVPTRELAVQVWEVFEIFFEALRRSARAEMESTAEDIKVDQEDGEVDIAAEKAKDTIIEATYPSPLLLVSGQSQSRSTTTNPPPSPIIISTPGRLASYLSSMASTSSSASTSAYARARRALSLDQFEVLTLDEADGLLSSKDHLKNLETVWKILPRQRRNWLFSATMMDLLSERNANGQMGMGALGGGAGFELAGLRNLTRVVVRVEAKSKRKRGDEEEGETAKKTGKEERRTPLLLQNQYLTCFQAEKTLQLIRLLRRQSELEGSAKYIVYFATCAAVDYFYNILKRLPALSHYHFSSLHGHLQPNIRTNTLASFTNHPSLPTYPGVLLCTDVAARGLDLPDVDVVIQYDPPGDPKSFSHRAGRTARMGRRGKAVILLAKGSEEEYVDFLKLRKMPLTRHRYLEEADLIEGGAEEPRQIHDQVDPAALELLEQMRDIVLQDRSYNDKAAKAFVSSIRAYSKHEASYIFRLKGLDMFGMSVSYGLLRIPKMPEVKEWRDRAKKEKERRAADGEEEEAGLVSWQDREVDWDNFTYTDKGREAHRKQEMVEAAAKKDETNAQRRKEAELRKERAKKFEAWSDKKEQKEKKDLRREKKDRRKDWEAREQKRLLEEGGGLEGTPLAALHKSKQQQPRQNPTIEAKPVAQEEAMAVSSSEDEDDEGELEEDYKEIKEERGAKRTKRVKPTGGMVGGGMFDDMS